MEKQIEADIKQAIRMKGVMDETMKAMGLSTLDELLTPKDESDES